MNLPRIERSGDSCLIRLDPEQLIELVGLLGSVRRPRRERLDIGDRIVAAFARSEYADKLIEPPPVVLGPGGSYRRPWPSPAPLTDELIGGSASAAIAEGTR